VLYSTVKGKVFEKLSESRNICCGDFPHSTKEVLLFEESKWT
jgi:hypothetical protein